MAWRLMSEEPVTFEERVFDDFLIGDELIKIEHSFNGATFPGLGYAVISNLYVNNERDFFRRSYPVKDSPRIYEVKVPPQLVEGNYLLHQLMVKRHLYARVDADANWRIRAYIWVPDGAPPSEVDGQQVDGGDEEIFDGSP